MPLRALYSHLTVLCLAVLSACTNDPEALRDLASPPAVTPPSAAPVSTGGAAPTASTATPALADGVPSPGASPEDAEAFRELIGADWELPPGSEQYVCARLTLTQTMLVNRWRLEAPFGTHHTLLTTSAQPDGKPDGVTECDAAALGTQLVLAAGVGTKDQKLPSGVAMKLPQGAQAILNLHLFNPTDNPLRGHSGARIQPMEEKDVRDIADLVNVTTLKLDIPPGRSTSHARCTLGRDATVFEVGPHMHQTGVALQAVAHTALHGDVVLFDGPYSFEDQRGYPVGPLQFKAGDTVDVACTYENLSAKTLHFGDSSKQEMCVLAIGRYPAGGPSICVK